MLSKYVYKINLCNGNLLLYNGLNKAMIEIENEEFIDNLSADQKEYLKSNYFLVDSQKDISTIQQEYIKKVKYSKDMLSLVIHTNYSCNLSCSYCYQNGIDSEIIMSENTAKEVLEFIREKCRDEKPIILDLCFIGGEPLLMYDMITFFLRNLDNNVAKIKRYSVITNGTFLTLDKYENLIKLGIKGFQITLDGFRDTHDAKRCNSKGDGSFDLIINNIRLICKKYPQNHIIINYNLDIETIKSIEKFLTLLSELKIKCPVIFSEIFDAKGVDTGKEISAESQLWYYAHKIAIDYGYRYDPFYRMSYLACGMKRINSLMINPKGEIYKCISGMEDKNYFVGHITEYKSSMFTRNLTKFAKENITQSCISCKYYPVCGGGCIYRNKEIKSRCYKTEIELNDIPLIKYQYEKDKKYN